MDSSSLKRQLKHCKKQKHEVNSGRGEDRKRGKHKVDVGGKMGRRGRDGGKKGMVQRKGTRERSKEEQGGQRGRKEGKEGWRERELHLNQYLF